MPEIIRTLAIASPTASLTEQMILLAMAMALQVRNFPCCTGNI
jgi:hypothetical protein